MSRVHTNLKSNLQASIARYKRFADTRRTAGYPYSENDWVMLDSRNLRLRQKTKKLGPRRIGPFRILAKIGPSSYRLALPPTMKVHPTFHESLLSRYHGTPPEDPLPLDIDGDMEYEVASIQGARFFRRQLQYLISWKGYGLEENSWEPAHHCNHCPELVQEFYKKNPSAPGHSSAPPQISAMKLPKNHKNFALGEISSGGIAPQQPMGDYVTDSQPLPGIDRPRRGQRATARPLRQQSDLSLVIDKRWVTAVPVKASPRDPRHRSQRNAKRRFGKPRAFPKTSQSVPSPPVPPRPANDSKRQKKKPSNDAHSGKCN